MSAHGKDAPPAEPNASHSYPRCMGALEAYHGQPVHM